MSRSRKGKKKSPRIFIPEQNEFYNLITKTYT